MLHRYLCACALLLAPLPGFADPVSGPDSLAVLLGSYHVNGSGFEEVNPGLFLTWEDAGLGGHVDFGVGAFRNSYGGASLSVSAAYPLVRTPDWGVDLFAALAWYPGDGDQFSHALGDLVPLAGLQARYRNVFVQAIPSAGARVDATLTYGLVVDLP